MARFRVSESEWERRRGVVARFAESGVSMAEFARREGVAYAAPGAWRKPQMHPTRRRIQRDLSAIVAAQTPGVTYTSTDAVSVWSSRCYLDDLRFSNTVTVEHNVLGAGVVGHILRNRTTNAATGAKTDRWFHYDQVGSVISESDAAGALAQTHHQDAFGNTQAAWQTGLWGGDRAGWHHNTKELDGDTGLVYMYQRWYSPETGTFMSSAPYPVMIEHRYGFAASRPTFYKDPYGNFLWPGFWQPITDYMEGVGPFYDWMDSTCQLMQRRTNQNGGGGNASTDQHRARFSGHA